MPITDASLHARGYHSGQGRVLVERCPTCYCSLVGLTHFTLEDMPMLHVLVRFALATIGAIVIVAFIFAFFEGMFDLGSYNWRYIRRSIVRSLTSR